MQMGCIMRPYFRGGTRIFAGGALEGTTVSLNARAQPAQLKILLANCSMSSILRTYFRGGLVSQANEVGALEGTTLFILVTTVSLNARAQPAFPPKK